MDDARQIGGSRHLDGPFRERLGDGHQRFIEHRLEQPMALLLLPGGEDDRRAGELGVVERAHGVAEPGHHVHIRSRQPPRGAGIAIGHRHDRRFLQAEHELELRILGHRFHDGELGGARIAEEMRDAFVQQKLDESAPAGDAPHGA